MILCKMNAAYDDIFCLFHWIVITRQVIDWNTISTYAIAQAIRFHSFILIALKMFDMKRNAMANTKIDATKKFNWINSNASQLATSVNQSEKDLFEKKRTQIKMKCNFK